MRSASGTRHLLRLHPTTHIYNVFPPSFYFPQRCKPNNYNHGVIVELERTQLATSLSLLTLLSN